MSNSLAACGGFCAGSQVVIDHQRINSTAFVFSAAMPALLAVASSEGISYLKRNPEVMQTIQEYGRLIRGTLAGVDGVELLGHPASPIVHIGLKAPTPLLIPPFPVSSGGKSNPHSQLPNPPPFWLTNVEHDDKILQEVVDECFALGILVTRAKRLDGQENVEVRRTIRVAVCAALTRKEVERAANILKTSLVKVVKSAGRR